MNKEEIEVLINLRQQLIEKFNRLKDYKNNTNAIMKEVEHARLIHDTVTTLDKVLKEHVEFSDKK